jgi:hypothetical protein
VWPFLVFVFISQGNFGVDHGKHLALELPLKRGEGWLPFSLFNYSQAWDSISFNPSTTASPPISVDVDDFFKFF